MGQIEGAYSEQPQEAGQPFIPENNDAPDQGESNPETEA